MRTMKWVPGLLISFLVAGCGGSPAAPSGPEQRQAGPLSLDEGDITAALSGSDLDVSLVVHLDGETPLLATMNAALQDLDGESAGSGSTTATLEPGANVVHAKIPGIGPQARKREFQAFHLLRYQVRTEAGTLFGARSLFVSMPKAQLVLLAPKSLYEGEATRVKVLFRDPVTGKPFPGRTLDLTLEVGEWRQQVQVKTNEFGEAMAEFLPEQSGKAEFLVSTQANSSGEGDGAKLQQSATVTRPLRVLVTTDKPRYQPGQTMHIRALALRKPALKPASDDETVLEVLDGKGNKVFKQVQKTNEFGIAAATFKLGREVNMGTYRIRATVGDTSTEKAVVVERYALPKFNVSVQLDRQYYIVGDTMKGTVQARYFFGKPVAGGKTKVELYTFDVEFTKVGEVSGTTNQDGIYQFELSLPSYMVGQALEQGKAIVRLVASVTDTAGQTFQKEVGVVVSGAELNAVVIPESGTIVPGIPNIFYVFVEDPASNPVEATVTIAVGEETLTTQTTKAGIGYFTVTPGQDGLHIQVEAKDKQGRSVSREFEFAPDRSGEAVLVRTDKAIYKVGQTAKVTVFAPDARDRVYVDVIRQRQLVREQALDLTDGKAVVEVDLDQEMTGDVVFDAYYLGRSGQVVRDEKLCYVQGADSLKVQVIPDKDTYKPGEEASVLFKVTDGSGAGSVAALGVQVVDEAVFALSDAKPGLLKTYFQLEDELQHPSFEIHGADFDLTSILAGSDDEGEADAKEQRAAAAFGAIGDVSPVSSASSWAKDLAELRVILKPKYDEQVQRIIESVRSRLQASGKLYDDVIPYLLETPFYDFFGNRYRVEVESASDETVAFVSAGPDEVFGTEDDYKRKVSAWEVRGGYWEEFGEPVPGGVAADASATGLPEENGKGTSGEEAPKVRKFFPETLYVNPALITDQSGEAKAVFQVADSITKWRISALANDLDGKLGSATAGLVVFMDFFVDMDLPRVMKRMDEVSFPIAVYNYLDKPQTVELTVEASDWAQILGGNHFTVSLGPSEVKGVYVKLKALEVGWHSVTVTAVADSGLSDAVQRSVEVDPDGTEVRGSESGRLEGKKSFVVSFDPAAIPGTEKIAVKVYPGVMAQAVEGLDSILRMPTGCFEQTTASLWPNALVLDYMQQAGIITPEIELKAREYINVGYQRLLTFECTGGGFTWFGDPNPANIILSAMAVMEFSDIGKVHEIDETIVPRTIEFLEGRQNADGGWHESQGSEFATVRYNDLMTTCFVLWSFGQADYASASGDKALSYIVSELPKTGSTYAKALCANALAWYAPTEQTTQDVIAELVDLAKESEGKVYWDAKGQSKDSFYGYSGDNVTIEVTALAAMALMKMHAAPDLVAGAIDFLASSKDSFGNWNTTHATILSLKTLVQSLSIVASGAQGSLAISMNGKDLDPLEISHENADVFRSFELQEYVQPGAENHLTLTFQGSGSVMYQVVWSYYLPGQAHENPSSPLRITVAYDKTHVAVDDIIGVTATVENVSDEVAPMVLVDLGIPPGFDLLTEKLDQAVAEGLIQKYETTAKQILVYVESILPSEQLEVQYELRAKYPLKVTAPDSSASLYYDPESKSSTPGEPIEVE